MFAYVVHTFISHLKIVVFSSGVVVTLHEFNIFNIFSYIT